MLGLLASVCLLSIKFPLTGRSVRKMRPQPADVSVAGAGGAGGGARFRRRAPPHSTRHRAAILYNRSGPHVRAHVLASVMSFREDGLSDKPARGPRRLPRAHLPRAHLCAKVRRGHRHVNRSRVRGLPFGLRTSREPHLEMKDADVQGIVVTAISSSRIWPESRCIKFKMTPRHTHRTFLNIQVQTD